VRLAVTDRPIFHLNETDPEKVERARRFYTEMERLVAVADGELWAKLYRREAMLMILYDEPNIEAATLATLVKYGQDAVAVLMVENHDARGIVMLPLPGRGSPREIMERQTGVTVPEKLR
jgi:hypothetical protein